MARAPSGFKKERLNLELPKEVKDRMEEVRTITKADSLADVVRRSLAVYELLVKRAGGASSITIVDKDGKQAELLLSY